jgi:hypothetical protein
MPLILWSHLIVGLDLIKAIWGIRIAPDFEDDALGSILDGLLISRIGEKTRQALLAPRLSSQLSELILQLRYHSRRRHSCKIASRARRPTRAASTAGGRC